MIKSILRQAYIYWLEPFLFAPLNFVLRSSKTRIGRSFAAQKYLSGSGIEIGAFASPTLVPLGVKVQYVDRVPASAWSNDPQYKGIKIIDPDIVDDGAVLSSIPDSSVDFVMCFHMIEHVPNTLEAVKNWLRVLRPEGVLIVSVPDKRFTRDCARSITTWDHVVSDFEAGLARNDNDHYRDVAKNIHGLSVEDTEALVNTAPPAIHFHVWDFSSFFMFWQNAIHYFGNAIDMVEVRLNQAEVLVVMRRRAPVLST